MKTLFQALLQIVMIFSLSFSAIASGENKVATVVVEHWPPWEIACDAKKKKVTEGLAVEIVQELFNRLNIKMKLLNAPWKRALYSIEYGKADLIPMIVKTSEREPYMIFTIPVYEDPLLFVYSTDKFKTFEWEQWEDLKPYKTTAYYFYSKKHYPNGLNIKGVSDFRKYRIVGLRGYRDQSLSREIRCTNRPYGSVDSINKPFQ